MAYCTSPITIYHKGATAPINPATGLPERSQVQCNRCPSCIAGRKNDWAGRLSAEALQAEEVYFVTLTYRDEPDEFHYRAAA